MTSLLAAAGGGAVAGAIVLLFSHAWPAITGLHDLAMAMLGVPLFALFAAMMGAAMGVFIAGPWVALAGTLMLVASARLGLSSPVPWLGAGLLGGLCLARLTPFSMVILDEYGPNFSLVGGALGGVAAAWLFRRCWLLLTGAEPGDVPGF
ncbi:hypothetical protein [Sphingomonas humi]